MSFSASFTYPYGVETHTFPGLDVADAVIEEQLKTPQGIKKLLSFSDEIGLGRKTKAVNLSCVLLLTVLRGLMLAILKTCSNAPSDGLHITGVFGSSMLGSGFAMSKISLVAVSTGDLVLVLGLRVSKDMILSKQSSRPSLAIILAP